MPEGDAEERTEDATPRQRDKAREEGRVTSSREVGTLAVLSTATLTIYYLGPYMTKRMSALIIHYLENLGTTDLTRGGVAILCGMSFYVS